MHPMVESGEVISIISARCTVTQHEVERLLELLMWRHPAHGCCALA